MASFIRGVTLANSNSNLKTTLSRRDAIVGATASIATTVLPRLTRAAPQSQLTWAIHVTLAPVWFDPATTPGLITPFMVLYAIHDALVKPMPDKALTPSLAESWKMSEDSKTYEFVLRQGIKFHNGDPVTAGDVKFSFERYHGASNKQLKDSIASIEIADPRHIRFNLKEPWPDFMTFYGSTATGAGWVVPKKYVEQVGDEGFLNHPIGAGPYKFVSFNPGVELVLEAFEGYWRKQPSVKQIVMKVIPDEETRFAALKRGEIDIAYSIRGELAEQVQKTAGLTLKPVLLPAPWYLYFTEQWDPKSPFHDVRVRKAVNLALDRDGMNKALFLGFCKVNNSLIPDSYQYYWQPPKAVYDPAQAKKLLAEAGYPNGFDAGSYFVDASYANIAEVAVGNLEAIGIHTKMQPVERATFFANGTGKKFHGIMQIASAAGGNAATRLAAFIVKGGAWVYDSYPDIDALYPKQADELDEKKRTAILDEMQQLVYEKSIDAPIFELSFINAIGPRVGESSFGKIQGFAYTAPFEDITIKNV